MLIHSLNFFIVKKNESLCCDYATDLCIYGNYASDNVCCILAGFQVLLSVTGMLVDISVTIMQVTVADMQLEVSTTHMQVTVSSANVWMTVSIMQMGLSVAVMLVVFSAVHYAHNCVYCNYAGDFPL